MGLIRQNAGDRSGPSYSGHGGGGHVLATTAVGVGLGGAFGWAFDCLFGCPSTSARVGEAAKFGALGGAVFGGTALLAQHGVSPLALGVGGAALGGGAAYISEHNKSAVQPSTNVELGVAAVVGAVAYGIGAVNKP